MAKLKNILMLVKILVINSCNIFNFLVANTFLATELGFFVSLFTAMTSYMDHLVLFSCD